MRFVFILVIALMIFGICGMTGGFVMLWAGNVLSRIDAFSATPFQAAVICTGVAIAFAVSINQLLAPFIFPPFKINSDEDEEYDRPVIRIRKPGKRR